MNTWTLGFVLGVLWLTPAQAEIQIRVSVKFIPDSNGNRPTGGMSTDAEIQSQIDYGNWVLAKTGRGYQLNLLPILEVRDAGEWSDIAAFGNGDDDDNNNDIDELEKEVEDSFKHGSNTFLFGQDAINIYIVQGNTASCLKG